MPKYYHRPGTLPKTAHKELKYKVVVYVNRKRQKVLYTSRTYYPALRKYKEYLENNNPIFPKMWDWLGNPLSYELVLLGNWGESLSKYAAPSGVVYSIASKTTDGFLIKEIHPYQIEEKFKYHNANKMVTFKDVVKIMVKEKYTKTIMHFSNKVLIEVYEKDELHLFIMKNKFDSQRLYSEIKKFYLTNHIVDCFFFTAPERGLELYDLYDRISKKLNISKSQLSKTSTRA
jgi:hypothetical protein